jgi:DNA-binding protein Fis
LRAILRTDSTDDALARALASAGLRVERVRELEPDAISGADVALVDPRLLAGGARPAELPAPSAAETLEDVCYERLAPILDRLNGERVPLFEKAVLAATERALLRLALERCGSVRGAADILGVHRNTLARRLEALGLRRSPRRSPRPPSSVPRRRRA